MLTGFIGLVYLVNLVIFTLTEKAQLTAGGLFLIALGTLWIYLMGGPETLICDRARDRCQIIKPRFLLQAKRVEAIRLTSIEEVKVDKVCRSSHDGPGRASYEVILRARDKGSFSFSSEYSQQTAAAIANRVKAFLEKAGHESLVVRRVPWLMIAIGVGGIGIGVLLIVSAVIGWLYTEC